MSIAQVPFESHISNATGPLLRTRDGRLSPGVWRCVRDYPRSKNVATTPRHDAAPLRGRGGGSDRRGFTALEMTMVVVILGIITAMLVPQLSSLTEKSEAGRAAMVVQQDLERTFTLAARLRKPMVLSADNTQHIYQVKDQTDDTVRLTRRLNLGQEFGVETMTFSNTSITVQPNGVASDTLGVTLVSRNTIRHVSMTRVGLIQRTQ
ncbi:MAG TPA: prepilin-type N-terminal cleavage/methylation domain-containing protein [Gemmatimonadales bacterium]